MADDDAPSYSQQNRLIQVSILLKGEDPTGKKKFSEDEQLLLESFTGQEGVSLPFTFELVLRSFADDLDFSDILGPAVIKMLVPSGENNQDEAQMKARYINGTIATFTRLAQTRSSDRETTHVFTIYQATLVPQLWMLTRRQNCRIFQKQTVPDIISQVLTENDVVLVSTRFVHPDRYQQRDYCVQYNETDFDFVSRLMEEEGIFYFFEHDEVKHVLVLANHPQQFVVNPLQPSLPYAARHGHSNRDLSDPDKVPPELGIKSWNISQERRPDKYMLRDFDYEHSAKPIEESSQDVATDAADCQVYEYPGEYTDRDRGQFLADTRMNQIEAAKTIINGGSNCDGLIPGYYFTLTDHFDEKVNGDYVVLSAFHMANQGDNYRADQQSAKCDYQYSNTIRCIPRFQPNNGVAGDNRLTPFAAPRTTQIPVISSTQTAIVVGRDATTDSAKPGAPKDEIYTDKYGRVKVRFHWDRRTDREGDCSCWIRVAQPWAGSGFGHQWIPRIGQEVVVTFLDGNPDRPLITGSVYNFDNLPPFDPSQHPTQSGMKTHSTPGGRAQNFNLIRFEDKKCHEQLWIHAENAMLESVEGSQAITVGGSRCITTGGEKDGVTHGDTKELVFKNANLHVKGDSRTAVDGKESVSVKGDCVQFTQGGYYASSSKEVLAYAPSVYIQGGDKIVLAVGGSSIVLDASGVTIVGPIVKLNPAGAVPPVVPILPLTDPPDDP